MRGVMLAVAEELCWGCKTCEAACKQENRAPTGVRLVRVTEEGPTQGSDGRWNYHFNVERCRHCENPPCREACAVEAIYKRPDTIVVLDGDLCVGCGACVEACPYGSIEMDGSGDKAHKCNLCHHRIDVGLLPACADNVCLAHCINLLDVREG